MTLATRQRQLLGLLKGNDDDSFESEPYIRAIAQSKNLEVTREIILWWRLSSLERYCVLTSQLLKQRKLFESLVQNWLSTHKISPFIEELGKAFLESLREHEDSLVASVAQFELALIKVKKGDSNTYVIDWFYEPYSVLNNLLRGEPVNEKKEQVFYQTLVSRKFLNLFQVRTIGQTSHSPQPKGEES
jgi:hypothetical protein